MKKLLLKLCAIGLSISPVVTAISCSSKIAKTIEPGTVSFEKEEYSVITGETLTVPITNFSDLQKEGFTKNVSVSSNNINSVKYSPTKTTTNTDAISLTTSKAGVAIITVSCTNLSTQVVETGTFKVHVVDKTLDVSLKDNVNVSDSTDGYVVIGNINHWDDIKPMYNDNLFTIDVEQKGQSLKNSDNKELLASISSDTGEIRIKINSSLLNNSSGSIVISKISINSSVFNQYSTISNFNLNLSLPETNKITDPESTPFTKYLQTDNQIKYSISNTETLESIINPTPLQSFSIINVEDNEGVIYNTSSYISDNNLIVTFDANTSISFSECTMDIDVIIKNNDGSFSVSTISQKLSAFNTASGKSEQGIANDIVQLDDVSDTQTNEKYLLDTTQYTSKTYYFDANKSKGKQKLDNIKSYNYTFNNAYTTTQLSETDESESKSPVDIISVGYEESSRKIYLSLSGVESKGSIDEYIVLVFKDRVGNKVYSTYQLKISVSNDLGYTNKISLKDNNIDNKGNNGDSFKNGIILPEDKEIETSLSIENVNSSTLKESDEDYTKWKVSTSKSSIIKGGKVTKVNDKYYVNITLLAQGNKDVSGTPIDIKITSLDGTKKILTTIYTATYLGASASNPRTNLGDFGEESSNFYVTKNAKNRSFGFENVSYKSVNKIEFEDGYSYEGLYSPIYLANETSETGNNSIKNIVFDGDLTVTGPSVIYGGYKGTLGEDNANSAIYSKMLNSSEQGSIQFKGKVTFNANTKGVKEGNRTCAVLNVNSGVQSTQINNVTFHKSVTIKGDDKESGDTSLYGIGLIAQGIDSSFANINVGDSSTISEEEGKSLSINGWNESGDTDSYLSKGIIVSASTTAIYSGYNNLDSSSVAINNYSIEGLPKSTDSSNDKHKYCAIIADGAGSISGEYNISGIEGYIDISQNSVKLKIYDTPVEEISPPSPNSNI